MKLRRSVAALSLVGLSTGVLSACSFDLSSSDAGSESSASATAAQGDDPSDSAEEQESEAPEPVTVEVNATGGDVAVDKVVTAKAQNGTLTKVTLSSKAGPIKGSLKNGTWTAGGLLEPGTKYTVKSVAEDSEGTSTTKTATFSTRALTLDEQTYPSVAPLQGETVGVGMPVVVNFDLPVTDKKAFEKHMKVTSTPQQAGSWHWLSDTQAHWRPKNYWKAGTDVSVAVDVNSVPAGNGLYGQENRRVSFHVGSANIYKVNAQTHQMQVFSNGDLLRTIPITTGEQPDYTTRSGIKVIMEKFASKRMNSETIGIDPDSSEGYDLDNVQYAMRVTSSGEFIHAAPWSVGSQGVANVSHGCTGMSTDNAAWLYNMTKRGDVVEYTGTDRGMTLDNGYGDWNESFKEYQAGSALHAS